jgi:hypothetical protein
MDLLNDHDLTRLAERGMPIEGAAGITRPAIGP